MHQGRVWGGLLWSGGLRPGALVCGRVAPGAWLGTRCTASLTPLTPPPWVSGVVAAAVYRGPIQEPGVGFQGGWGGSPAGCK